MNRLNGLLGDLVLVVHLLNGLAGFGRRGGIILLILMGDMIATLAPPRTSSKVRVPELGGGLDPQAFFGGGGRLEFLQQQVTPC